MMYARAYQYIRVCQVFCIVYVYSFYYNLEEKN